MDGFLLTNDVAEVFDEWLDEADVVNVFVANDLAAVEVADGNTVTVCNEYDLVFDVVLDLDDEAEIDGVFDEAGVKVVDDAVDVAVDTAVNTVLEEALIDDVCIKVDLADDVVVDLVDEDEIDAVFDGAVGTVEESLGIMVNCNKTR